jgi:hypothetical protein
MEPSQNQITPPSFPPPAPVITTPSVFETKPGKEKQKMSVRVWITTGTIIFLVLIVILYFWGAHLTGQA